MGGILGKLSFDRQVTISTATVQRMIDAVAHRGAAAAGGHRASYVGHGIALASCDDVPSPFPQVAHNESGTVRAVADSDLSNAASLRRVLEDRGHRVCGSTDAELIAHAYEEWGDACVERFSGPFACAIWDEMQRRLLLARDRFGVRPLCFALLHDRGVVFGSEIKPLLQDPSVGREWHPEAIDAYLALGYVPAPLTIHRRVSKLEPAHTLVVEGRRLTTRRYWGFAAHCNGAAEREAIDLLESCLRRSVASDDEEPDACVLISGGLASTAIAAMLPRGRTTVAIGIERDTSHLERLSDMAAHLGLRSEIDLAVADGIELATVLASQFDEPVADPAAVSQYAVFAAARRYTDLALTGHGASALWDGPRARMLFCDTRRHRLYTRRFSWQVREANPLDRFGDTAHTSLPGSQLVVADAAAAAAHLRLRHPFLDRDLADLAFTLPDHLKLRGTTSMYALRRVVARHLPASLLPPPADAAPKPAWLANAVVSLVPDVLLGDRFDTRGIFNRAALQELWDAHRWGRHDHMHRLWSLLMLEFWFREFIDGDTAAQPVEHAVLVRAA